MAEAVHAKPQAAQGAGSVGRGKLIHVGNDLQRRYDDGQRVGQDPEEEEEDDPK